MKTSKQIAVNTAYFHRDAFLDSVRKLASIGVKKIEVNGLALHGLGVSGRQELATYLRDQGMQVVSVNTVPDLIPVNLGNLTAFNDRERQAAVTHVLRCLDYCVELNCPALVIDRGTTTEDSMMLANQDDRYFLSLQEILPRTEQAGKELVILNVPGRRWQPWDGIPPDSWRVVERHVWPWRAWLDEEELVREAQQRVGGKVKWALDTANTVVACGNIPFTLKERAEFYQAAGLRMVYLANHPGPFNRVWHRALLHTPLDQGYFKQTDYRELISALAETQFRGNLILQIVEKEPTVESLLSSLKIIASCKAK